MYLYGDIVKSSKHKYIVVSVDDSDPTQVLYGVVPYNEKNIVEYKITMEHKEVLMLPTMFFFADRLEFVEPAPDLVPGSTESTCLFRKR